MISKILCTLCASLGVFSAVSAVEMNNWRGDKRDNVKNYAPNGEGSYSDRLTDVTAERGSSSRFQPVQGLPTHLLFDTAKGAIVDKESGEDVAMVGRHGEIFFINDDNPFGKYNAIGYIAVDRRNGEYIYKIAYSTK